MKTERASKLLSDFAARLSGARTARGIESQAELGRLLGLSPDTITKWEGGRNYPRVPELLELCSILNVSADYLLFGNPNGVPVSTIRAIAAAATPKRKPDGAAPN